ncbi:MAG: adenylyl-sulfate kinase [Nitrospira sp. CG24E]|nr:MAG: adenylyl-sulfate kinase [Nitrospira sp. CG24E]
MGAGPLLSRVGLHRAEACGPWCDGDFRSDPTANLEHGKKVIFDATASRRVYRDVARAAIPRFIEVAVECPLATCMERDKKGTYRKGQSGESHTVPGLQFPYEEPVNPDLRIDSTTLLSTDAAGQIRDLVNAKFL